MTVQLEGPAARAVSPESRGNQTMKVTNSTALTILLLAAGLCGCEPMVLNEGEVTNRNVAGTWAYVDTSGGRSTWTLYQADDASLTGTGTSSETITGFVSGDAVQMTLTYDTNVTTKVNGTVVNSTMSGTFTNSVSATGSWTAYKTN